MREKILFDKAWQFHKGDINIPQPQDKGPAYMQSKTERYKFGPASRYYDDISDGYDEGKNLNPVRWETVDLPHDYIIEQKPEKQYNNAWGYFNYENAWYRKKFTLNEEDKDKRICLFFEGVAVNATVYLNGCLLKHNFCGYSSFEVDITDFAEFDNENVLAVYVNTQNHEGWWYEGGGIYRHVWLVKTEKTAVDLWGLYIAPKKEGNSWTVSIENTLRNDFDEEKSISVVTKIFDGEKEILSLSAEAKVSARRKETVKMCGTVKNPTLWDIDSPNLCRGVSYVYSGDELTDVYETRFGFRDFYIDPQTGLFLNDRHVLIKGVCAHQDFGLTGKAVPDNIQKHKIKLIKEMGANGYRCSHYPHSEATMDALDETGFITMAESRWFSSSEESLEQLEMLIKRDRNRPSVFFWSVENEEPHEADEVGRKICKTMMAKIKSLDNTRIVTAAVSRPDTSVIYDELDAIGINYCLESYDRLHEKYPNKPIFASECCATGTTRGWYFDDDPQKGYINSIDKDTNNWFKGRENTWKFLTERKWILGGFQWIAFEHRGECMWPRLCSQSGAIDLFLQKKDAFYQNQSHWIENSPVIHLLPHWNFEGFEGEDIRTVVYTNCDEAELFLNGKSLGRKKIEKYGHGEWQVKYEKGEICAVGYKNGEKVIEDKKKTSEKAHALKLIQENNICADNEGDIALITCMCVDKNGNEVYDAAPFVSFTSSKGGKIVGTGSDVSDHSPVTETSRQMRAGRISVALKCDKTDEPVKIYAQSDNLKSAVLTIIKN